MYVVVTVAAWCALGNVVKGSMAVGMAVSMGAVGGPGRRAAT